MAPAIILQNIHDALTFLATDDDMMDQFFYTFTDVISQHLNHALNKLHRNAYVTFRSGDDEMYVEKQKKQITFRLKQTFIQFDQQGLDCSNVDKDVYH